MKTTAEIKELYKRWKIYTYNDTIPNFHLKWNMLNQGHAFSIEWNTDLNLACFHTNGDEDFATDEEFNSKLGTLA
mgnify:CR=1 FL=1